MASLLSPARTDDPTRTNVLLRAAEAVRRPDPDAADGPAPIGWPVAAVIGGVASAAAGWVLVVGIAVAGWVGTDPGALTDVLHVGTRLWLLANGVSAVVGTLPVTLVPAGATALMAYLLHWFGGYAARRVRPGSEIGALSVTAVLMVSFALPVLGVAVFLGEPWLAPLHWLGVLALLGLAGYHGATRAGGGSVTQRWPQWLRDLPTAILGGQLVLLCAGLAVLVSALVVHRERVAALTEALAPGAVGGVVLVVAQLAFLPNALAWCGSYALGAGFTLGNGSVVAPAATQLGVLPGVPVLGALPGAGPGSTLQLWWLAAGVVAGALSAWLFLRRWDRVRVDLASLAGGLAGLAAAAGFVGLAWVSSGDLGSVRLAGLGPRLLPLLVMAATTLGLSGMITGLVVGLLRRRR